MSSTESLQPTGFVGIIGFLGADHENQQGDCWLAAELGTSGLFWSEEMQTHSWNMMRDMTSTEPWSFSTSHKGIQRNSVNKEEHDRAAPHIWHLYSTWVPERTGRSSHRWCVKIRVQSHTHNTHSSHTLTYSPVFFHTHSLHTFIHSHTNS